MDLRKKKESPKAVPLHWGGHCQRPDYSRLIPVYQLFDVETKLVLGEEGYAELEKITASRAGGTRAQRG